METASIWKQMDITLTVNAECTQSGSVYLRENYLENYKAKQHMHQQVQQAVVTLASRSPDHVSFGLVHF